MNGSKATGSVLGLALRVWRLLDAVQQRRCVLVLLLSIVSACVTLVGITGVTPFFAVLADPSVIERTPALVALQQALAVETPQGLLIWLGAGFVVLLLLTNVTDYAALLSIGRLSQSVGARLHTLLFDEYLHRDLEFHRRSNGAALTARVVYEVGRTVGVVQSGLALVAGTVSIVLIVGAVVVISPVVAAAATVLFAVSYALVYGVVRRRLVRNGVAITRHARQRAQVIAESFASIEDVILYRGQRELTARVERHSAELAAAQADTPAIAASPKYVLECVTGAGLVAAALWIHGGAGGGRLLPELAFLGLAAYRLLPAFQRVFAASARLRSERAAFDGIADDLHRARRRTAAMLPAVDGDRWRGRPRRLIRLVDVSYCHSPERASGVSNVSLEIPAGAVVGLVGPNGAGKTTLAGIVLGLLAPQTGRIEIDGETLDDANRDAWRATVAHVPQRIALLDATIAENIAFGIAPGEIDLARVVEAANSARLGPIIAALPNGVRTTIGENGMQLSGGQRQRLAIARALYRRASLLVLDEATDALDAPTEAEIVALLGDLRGRCTVILIAHRPSMLAACDVSFELDGGRLVSRRTRAESAVGALGARALR